MLFNYKALDSAGNEKSGSVDAVSQDIAITSLQRRGLTISAITAADEGDSFFALNISFFDRVTNKDVVILSRQISVLFEAQVSALRIFRLLAAESEKLSMAKVLTAVADDLQGGSAISKALARHPKIFSPFYV